METPAFSGAQTARGAALPEERLPALPSAKASPSLTARRSGGAAFRLSAPFPSPGGRSEGSHAGSSSRAAGADSSAAPFGTPAQSPGRASQIVALKAQQDGVFTSHLHDNGALVKTVQALIQQRQRRRFEGTMNLLKLQLRMKLPAPTSINDEGGANAIINRYTKGSGGVKVAQSSSSDDDDDSNASDAGKDEGPRPRALINAEMTNGAAVKAALLREVTASQHDVQLQYNCALTNRPPPNVKALLREMRTAPPAIEGLSRTTSTSSCAVPGQLHPVPSGDQQQSRRGDGNEEISWEASTSPRKAAAAGGSNPPVPPLQLTRHGSNKSNKSTTVASPTTLGITPRNGSHSLAPRPPSETGRASPHRTGSRHTSRKSSMYGAFITEVDDRGMPLDEAALRARRIAAARKEPQDFDQLRNSDRHAQHYRRTHWTKQQEDARILAEQASARKRAKSVAVEDQQDNSSAALLGRDVSMKLSDVGRQLTSAALTSVGTPPETARSTAVPGLPPAVPEVLTTRHAQYTAKDVTAFLDTLRREGNKFHEQSVKEIARVRQAHHVFRQAKVETINALFDEPHLRTAPAKKVLKMIRSRVKRAAKAKDQAERLDVYYDQIIAIRKVIQLLFQVPSQIQEATAFLDAVRERVTLRDGRQDAAEFENVSLQSFPPERLLHNAVVELLSLVAPMFTISSTAFQEWVDGILHRYDEREGEYLGAFRNVEQRIGRDAATEAKFKLTIHTVRGFGSAATGRPHLYVRVVAEKKTVQTATLAGLKPLWHESHVLHIMNDSNPILLYVHCDGDVIGHGALSIGRIPPGQPQKMWLPTPGASSSNSQLQLTVEVYPPVMFHNKP